jgi:hypothetical protein
VRDLRALDDYRIDATQSHGWSGDGTCGAFRIPSPIDQAALTIIASAGFGWDHVSVSRSKRCPNWVELDFVKRLFFADDEVAVQFHVPGKDHINLHPNCLHLWRPQTQEIPLPPAEFV